MRWQNLGNVQCISKIACGLDCLFKNICAKHIIFSCSMTLMGCSIYKLLSLFNTNTHLNRTYPTLTDDTPRACTDFTAAEIRACVHLFPVIFTVQHSVCLFQNKNRWCALSCFRLYQPFFVKCMKVVCKHIFLYKVRNVVKVSNDLPS